MKLKLEMNYETGETFYIEVKPTQKQIEGHKKTSEKLKGRHDIGMSGHKHSDETKQKMSESAKNCEKYTMEQRTSGLAYARTFITEESIEKARQSNIGKVVSDETRKKLSEKLKGVYVGELHPMFGKHHTQEAIEKIRVAAIKQWQDPEMIEKITRSRIDASFKRPTSAETKCRLILDEICKDQYIYNGDGKFIVNKSIPDFVNCNGQKKVIEVFGDYWHSEYITGKPEETEILEKINKYLLYGFKCLIIWESELKNVNNVIDRINEFNELKSANLELGKQLTML